MNTRLLLTRLSTLFIPACMLFTGCGSKTSDLERTFADSNDPEYAAAQDTSGDPRISQSSGVEGGLVVLWPRVVPASNEMANLAYEIQNTISDVATRLWPRAEVDVRPSPERACPHSGCKAAAVSAVLVHRGAGCALVLSVSHPGPTEPTLSALVGDVNLRSRVIPFREPPENHIQPRDFVRCTDVVSLLNESTSKIETELAGIGGGETED